MSIVFVEDLILIFRIYVGRFVIICNLSFRGLKFFVFMDIVFICIYVYNENNNKNNLKIFVCMSIYMYMYVWCGINMKVRV